MFQEETRCGFARTKTDSKVIRVELSGTPPGLESVSQNDLEEKSSFMLFRSRCEYYSERKKVVF